MKERLCKILLNTTVGIAVILYLLNMASPLIAFEIGAYVVIVIYCIFKIFFCTDEKKTQGIDYVGFVSISTLTLESSLLIYFITKNESWIVETGKDKPSVYKKFIDFLRLIFLSQILLLQIKSKKYPLLAINILLFVFWVTTYTMLIVMLDNQKIF